MRTLLSLLRPRNASKLLWLVLISAVLLVATSPAGAKRPSSLYDQGRAAEAKQDYEAAYGFFQLAYEQKPNDVSYRAAVVRTRVLAASVHVNRGQQLRDHGELDAALLEFKKAAAIDPASFIAQQEIRRTQVMLDASKAGANPPPVDPTLKYIDAIPSNPIELQPLSTDPITLNLTEDAKNIYQILAKLAGINVLIDPEYQSKRIHVELHGVTLNEALALLAVESKTYWQPMTSNTIFVTSDTAAKRKDLEPSVVKTFYLSNLSQTSDLQEIVTALRTILELTRMTPLPSQGAILVRGTPDQVTLAGKLIDDLDKARPEVVVEVAIMQVNREHIRNLGIQLPTSASVSYTGGGVGVSGGSGSGSGQVSLNHLPNLNATDFSVTIPSATANFLASQSNSSVLQNPQIRALDGQKATLKIGERVPIAVGSYTAGATATSALVNTQFQYIDVGVNIDVTPTVHGGKEVTLKVSIDVSAVDNEVSIGGISEPVIGQRRIEHTIRLKEGEVNLLGGLMENSDVRSISGYPGLMNVPILKYLFGNENTDKRQTETVFVLIPHIVRIQEITPLNLKQLEVGTSNTIELRHLTPAKSEKPATALPASGNKPSSDATPPAAGAPPAAAPARVAPPPPAQSSAAPAQPTAAPPTVIFNFDPAHVATAVGQNFTVDLIASGAQDLTSVPLRIQYDPALLKLVSVVDGGFLGKDGQHVELTQHDDSAKGSIEVTAMRPVSSAGVSGGGRLLTFTFAAQAEGQATLSITRAGLRDAKDQNVPASGSPVMVEIRK